MRFFILLATILTSIESFAMSTTLGCFGFHGPIATTKTAFAKDIDITSDINDQRVSFRTYPMISHNHFQLDVVLNFPLRELSLNLTKGGTTSMSIGKFQGTKLVLVDSKTSQNNVYVECGVVTAD